MNIDIHDKKLFLNHFLLPLSKINDSCVITVSNDALTSVVCTSDSSVILHTSYKVETNVKSPKDLNIADVRKVIKAFDCIAGDSFKFSVDENNLSYSGPEIRFKYHLLEDGIITKPKINVEKLGDLSFPITFTVQYKTLLELLRGSTFTTESNKLYLYSENNKIFGDLTDRARHNVDSLSLPLCDYSGPPLESLCLNFELIRIISGVRVKQLECRVNPKIGIIVFQIADGDVKAKYIASSLVK